ERLIVTHDQLDANPSLLGTPSGFVDLETGKSYAPERGKLITMVTGIDPAPPGARSDEYINFLYSTYPIVPIVAGCRRPNKEVIRCLQRFAGYALTGHVIEHLCVFLLGRGANGKGRLTQSWQSAAGDYATTINAESLMERPYERHRSEFAVLRGKRLIFCR